ncbi:MAG TPA: hypothetical protein VGQ42_15740 [Candidatus Dormibacteraeota bacterium]|jgi:hypothetical protein|nr:hypothetical protein [Candidatus Dormibacteraeota bacterium]
MPYIDPERRKEMDASLIDPERRVTVLGPQSAPRSVGDLNYAITRLCHRTLDTLGCPPRYSDYNAVIGVLECVKQELYRRLVVPYEDECIERNGDVLPKYREVTS